MYKLGLKLWSINTDNYLQEAVKLYDNGVYDYIELYVVPDSLQTLQKWKELKMPFIIHNSHFAQGFNLAKQEKTQRNREIYEETKQFADELNAEYIIFHGGIDGDIRETAIQLTLFNEPRALLENKPFVALPNRMNGNFCRGYNVDEIKIVQEASGCGFCLDFGHAICAANSLYDMQAKKIQESAPLAPCGRGVGGEGYKKASHFYTRQSLEYSKDLRKNMTEPEQILWYYLRNKQFDNLKFRRQEAIGNYIADFVCYEKKLIIELDGSGHIEKKQAEHDKRRDEFLKQSGFKVIRVFNTDVYENIEGVIEYILCNVQPEPLTPNPSPTRGEGNNLITREEFIYSYIEQFLKLNPDMFHLTDIEDMTSIYDSHPHLGTGQLDIKRVLKYIPDNKHITLETIKNSKDNIDDFINDIIYVKGLMNDYA